MISREDVRHIAKLARLGLTDKEIEGLQKDLSSILDYIEKLKEVDVSNVEPMSHSITVENVTRQDVAKSAEPETIKKIIEQMPEEKQGYLKVRSVF